MSDTQDLAEVLLYAEAKLGALIPPVDKAASGGGRCSLPENVSHKQSHHAHQLGKRILDENDNFKRSKIYGKEITSRVSLSLGKSIRTIERSMQFARKFPDLGLLPEGKNISWHKICNNLLPEPKKPDTPELPSGKYNIIYADPPWKYDFCIESVLYFTFFYFCSGNAADYMLR